LIEYLNKKKEEEEETKTKKANFVICFLYIRIDRFTRLFQDHTTQEQEWEDKKKDRRKDQINQTVLDYVRHALFVLLVNSKDEEEEEGEKMKRNLFRKCWKINCIAKIRCIRIGIRTVITSA